MPLLKARSNSLVSNSFFIFIIRFFPSLANLVVLILYSKYLPQATYGDYQHFWIHLYVLYPFICFGIHVLIITYSRGFIINVVKRFKATHYLAFVAWAVLLSGVFAWLQYKSINLSFVVPFLFILCYGLTFIFESFLIVCKSYVWLTTINVLYSVAFGAIHWYVLVHGFSLPALFSYLLIITFLRLLFYILITIVNFRKQISEVITEPYLPTRIRSLWLHMGLFDILQMLSGYIDKFVISILLTAQLSAIYYNGSQNIPFLPLLLSAAGSAVLIQLAGSKIQVEATDSVRLMNQSGKVLSSIVFPLFFFLLFFNYDLIVTLFTDKYIPAIPVFIVATLVVPVRAYSFTTVLQRLHRGDIINIGAVSELVLACGLMYPFYLWLGLPGVALSFVISTYFQAVFYLVWSARLLHTSPLKLIPYANWLIKLIVFASLFITIHYVADQYFSRKIALVSGMLVLIIVTCVSLYIELKNQRKDVTIQ
jgi:O-antigen/teichoic acid export membrane protein